MIFYDWNFSIYLYDFHGVENNVIQSQRSGLGRAAARPLNRVSALGRGHKKTELRREASQFRLSSGETVGKLHNRDHCQHEGGDDDQGGY